MTVQGDDLIPVSNPAYNVSKTVDINAVKHQLLHLSFNAFYNLFLLAALARIGYHLSQKITYILPISLRSFLYFLIIHIRQPPYTLTSPYRPSVIFGIRIALCRKQEHPAVASQSKALYSAFFIRE